MRVIRLRAKSGELKMATNYSFTMNGWKLSSLAGALMQRCRNALAYNFGLRIPYQLSENLMRTVLQFYNCAKIPFTQSSFLCCPSQGQTLHGFLSVYFIVVSPKKCLVHLIPSWYLLLGRPESI